LFQYPSAAIIIPVLNEEEIIATTVQRSLPFATTIVVDNGSTDNSAAIAQRMGAIVVAESRAGYGRAILTGMAEAKRLDKQFVVILDADLSNDPEDIPAILEPVLSREYDLCLAARTRLQDKQTLEPHQRFGNKLATQIMYFITGYRYQDLGPFRAFHLDSIRNLDMQDPTFGWNIEMQMKAVQQQLRLKEIILPHHKRKAGVSKISGNLSASVKAGIIILKTAIRYAR